MKLIVTILLICMIACTPEREFMEVRDVRVTFVKIVQAHRWVGNQYLEIDKYLYEDSDREPYLCDTYEGLVMIIHKISRTK